MSDFAAAHCPEIYVCVPPESFAALCDMLTILCDTLTDTIVMQARPHIDPGTFETCRNLDQWQRTSFCIMAALSKLESSLSHTGVSIQMSSKVRFNPAFRGL